MYPGKLLFLNPPGKPGPQVGRPNNWCTIHHIDPRVMHVGGSLHEDHGQLVTTLANGELGHDYTRLAPRCKFVR